MILINSLLLRQITLAKDDSMAKSSIREIRIIVNCPTAAGMQAAIEGGLNVVAITTTGLILSYFYIDRVGYMKEIKEWKERTLEIASWASLQWTQENWEAMGFQDLGIPTKLSASAPVSALVRMRKENRYRRICVLGLTHSLIMHGRSIDEKNLLHG
jgi:hypothetical protein